ncbi:E1-E2 ATPase [Sphingobium faniae]|nr:E1-E2 ATPase [Sphingobium faniae]
MTLEAVRSPSTAGLTSAIAARLLEATGPNELGVKSERPAWRLLVTQFNSPVIWLLLVACVVSALVGEVIDAAAIRTIVLINGLVGFFQEYQAEKAVLALRAMTAPRARVIRDGRMQVIAAAAVVPTDIGTIRCSAGIKCAPISRNSTGSVRTSPIQKRRVMSISS